MNTGLNWRGVLGVLAYLAILVGSIDPIEGAVAIAGGSVLLVVVSRLSEEERPKLRSRSIACALTVLGVAALFTLSAQGGFGGRYGLSWWWGLLILPYVAGWWMSLWAKGNPPWVYAGAGAVGILYMAIPLLAYAQAERSPHQRDAFLLGLGAAGLVIFGVSLWRFLSAKPTASATSPKQA